MKTPPAKPPDLREVESGLKDFQRATTDYVFRRLYLDQPPTRRFLVADEVGLGKTLVAKGVIARTIRQLWETKERIDIVYICSNRDIARQNVTRLNVSGQNDFTLASRLTLLPIEMANLRGNRMNFISFTPETSFNLRSSMGRKKERQLLYWMLKDEWGFEGAAPLNVFQGRAGRHRFRSEIKRFPQRFLIDERLAEDFRRAVRRRIEKDCAAGRTDLRARYDDLASRFHWARENIPMRDRIDRREFIGDLRRLLAISCVQALEPDLVILDEFQRFKDLLVGEDEAGLLAKQLFEYQDEVAHVRVLLLSATPYKMYTLTEESAEDDHYRDFLHTLRFLFNGDSRTAEVEELLTAYRRGLYRLGDEEVGSIRALKNRIEARLREVMVRTERLAASPDRAGMLAEHPAEGVELTTEEVQSYLSLQEVARHLDHGDVIRYWKSAPYLLSFMEGYKLKEQFREAVELAKHTKILADVLRDGSGLSLPWSEIEEYRQVDPGNARLRGLMRDVIESGTWRLLWVPAAAPYYKRGEPYSDAGCMGFTKRLVFSAWRVVPRAVSLLISYEAERRMMQSAEEAPLNTREARERHRPLLNFTMSEGRLTGMPVLGILYPSAFFAAAGDPLKILQELGAEQELPRRQSVLARLRGRIQNGLAPILDRVPGDAPVDESWYWAAPILLDLKEYPESTHAWFRREGLPGIWSAGGDDASGTVDEGRWADHVTVARELVEGERQLGRPPDDLVRVLAKMAVAGPGVVALRALGRIRGEQVPSDDMGLRDAAGGVAWAFRTLFNQPEAMAIVRGIDDREPYWLRAVEYALRGNLQAVMDEFVHVLREALGFVGDGGSLEAAKAVAQEIQKALGLRTVSLTVDDVEVDPAGDSVRINRKRMRSHFASRFGDEKGSPEEAGHRAEQVRVAFNSPFWPFVLATTSVGQEGLDFHTYCHAVIHWNLPSNPVDLEQREGRVHRYKGHAVRKNLAEAHRAEMLTPRDGAPDPWGVLFTAGAEKRQEDESELVPYWVYRVDGGAQIERYVPALPLSRDLSKLASLRRSLAIYRMVFGQPRQDDLVEYLMERFEPETILEWLGELRIDLAPPGKPTSGIHPAASPSGQAH